MRFWNPSIKIIFTHQGFQEISIKERKIVYQLYWYTDRIFQEKLPWIPVKIPVISDKNYRKNSKNSQKFGYSLITVNYTVIFPEKFYPCR